eukprot:14419496-Ditylum_brightwellii.AAC.1
MQQCYEDLHQLVLKSKPLKNDESSSFESSVTSFPEVSFDLEEVSNDVPKSVDVHKKESNSVVIVPDDSTTFWIISSRCDATIVSNSSDALARHE